MTDYNDGNWHGWNGGECPVHPESLIELRTPSGYHETDRKAGITEWASPRLFRVTKPYVEPPKPREFWINFYADAIGSPYSVFESEQRAIDYTQKGMTQRIHVREVIEE